MHIVDQFEIVKIEQRNQVTLIRSGFKQTGGFLLKSAPVEQAGQVIVVGEVLDFPFAFLDVGDVGQRTDQAKRFAVIVAHHPAAGQHPDIFARQRPHPVFFGVGVLLRRDIGCDGTGPTGQVVGMDQRGKIGQLRYFRDVQVFAPVGRHDITHRLQIQVENRVFCRLDRELKTIFTALQRLFLLLQLPDLELQVLFGGGDLRIQRLDFIVVGEQFFVGLGQCFDRIGQFQPHPVDVVSQVGQFIAALHLDRVAEIAGGDLLDTGDDFMDRGGGFAPERQRGQA